MKIILDEQDVNAAIKAYLKYEYNIINSELYSIEYINANQCPVLIKLSIPKEYDV